MNLITHRVQRQGRVLRGTENRREALLPRQWWRAVCPTTAAWRKCQRSDSFSSHFCALTKKIAPKPSHPDDASTPWHKETPRELSAPHLISRPRLANSDNWQLTRIWLLPTILWLAESQLNLVTSIGTVRPCHGESVSLRELLLPNYGTTHGLVTNDLASNYVGSLQHTRHRSLPKLWHLGHVLLSCSCPQIHSFTILILYSQLSLKPTPSGPKLLSGLERCPL